MARRVATNSSLDADAKARTRTRTLPYEVSTGKVQDKFPAYQNFPWEEIEAFLKAKWPDWTEFKQAHIGDNWVFEIPEKLTEGDKKALRTLRDARRGQRESVSPER